MSMLQRLPANKLKQVAAGALVVYPLATMAARFDLWHFRNSFLLFALATLIAFVVLVLSVLKLSKAQQGDSKPLVIAIVLSMVPLAVMGINIMKANQYPFIHDISTDTQNPPALAAAASLRTEEDHSVDYEGKAIADLQLAAYPDVRPMVLNQGPSEVVVKAKAAMLEKGWEIVAEQTDVLPYTLEAVDTTLLMGFKDDIVVRIQSHQSGQSIVDMRSKSRQGKSDLGQNAKRITGFFKQLHR